MYIRDIVDSKQTCSFEYFPPKESSQEPVLFETAAELSAYKPDYVSVTYGAGGSTNDKTLRWIKTLKHDYGFTPMMHLTCTGNTRASVATMCESLRESGIKNLLALRGDPANNPTDAVESDFTYADELVSFIAANYGDIQMGVAGYPEKHPQSPDFERDVFYLKRKVDAGASFIVTQLFFNNEPFFRFLDRIEKAGIDVPVMAGIMPVVSLSQVKRMVEMCAVTLPPAFLDRLEKAAPEDVVKVGIDYALNQCRELLEKGVRGIHYYTLNRYASVRNILERL